MKDDDFMTWSRFSKKISGVRDFGVVKCVESVFLWKHGCYCCRRFRVGNVCVAALFVTVMIVLFGRGA